jgi:hypothetical protein
MPRLFLYPFRYRSEIAGKWVKARYAADLHEVARRADWEIIGPPEIRNVDPVPYMRVADSGHTASIAAQAAAARTSSNKFSA